MFMNKYANINIYSIYIYGGYIYIYICVCVCMYIFNVYRQTCFTYSPPPVFTLPCFKIHSDPFRLTKISSFRLFEFAPAEADAGHLRHEVHLLLLRHPRGPECPGDPTLHPR